MCNDWTIMLKIVIIFALISLINYSETCVLTNADVVKLEESLISAVYDMEKKSLNEDAIICVGTTRAGKSTLINYLMGNPLLSISKSNYGDYKIIKADNITRGPEIGAGPNSKTTIPTEWNSSLLPGLKIWDSPGFDDTRGTIQETTNSFYMYQLMKNIKSIRFVLVTDFHDINKSSLTSLSNLLNNLLKFFDDTFEDFFPSITFILSKVPYMINDVPVNIEYINYTLNDKLSSITKLNYSPIFIKFLRNIVTNNDRIGLFRSSNKAGIITSDIELNIFSAIKKSKGIPRKNFQNIGSSVSDQSLLCLQSIEDRFIKRLNILKLNNYLLNIIYNKTSNCGELVKNKNMTALHAIRKNLTDIKTLINKRMINENIYKNIETIEIIDIRMREIIKERQLLCQIKIIKFISQLLNSNIFKIFNDSITDLIKSLQTTIEGEIIHTSMLINDLNINDSMKSVKTQSKSKLKFILTFELFGTLVFSVLKSIYSSIVNR
ncbi:uncharacterized protein LOC122505768 [Leptopilina heterotoma]|uniref:uncharacterized protein LOC122505768 n=1 Tax=Leptopilina heterotoma TaxID=63436 RepID=UPI001CA99362|nr:uncharacterized protein LOC122505768 [Leptopilina heterotoma]